MIHIYGLSFNQFSYLQLELFCVLFLHRYKRLFVISGIGLHAERQQLLVQLVQLLALESSLVAVILKLIVPISQLVYLLHVISPSAVLQNSLENIETKLDFLSHCLGHFLDVFFQNFEVLQHLVDYLQGVICLNLQARL